MVFPSFMRNRYYSMAAAITYGVTRKVLHMREAKVERYTAHGKVTVPVLLTEKVLIAGACGMAGVYLWPLYVYSDLCHAEITLRRRWSKNPDEAYPKDEEQNPTSLLYYFVS